MKRSSVRVAQWSETREKSYENYCNEILFHRNLQVVFVEDSVYLKDGDEETFLTVVTKPKQTWYEIWKCLKDKFGVTGIIDLKK